MSVPRPSIGQRVAGATGLDSFLNFMVNQGKQGAQNVAQNHRGLPGEMDQIANLLRQGSQIKGGDVASQMAQLIPGISQGSRLERGARKAGNDAHTMALPIRTGQTVMQAMAGSRGVGGDIAGQGGRLARWLAENPDDPQLQEALALVDQIAPQHGPDMPSAGPQPPQPGAPGQIQPEQRNAPQGNVQQPGVQESLGRVGGGIGDNLPGAHVGPNGEGLILDGGGVPNPQGDVPHIEMSQPDPQEIQREQQQAGSPGTASIQELLNQVRESGGHGSAIVGPGVYGRQVSPDVVQDIISGQARPGNTIPQGVSQDEMLRQIQTQLSGELSTIAREGRVQPASPEAIEQRHQQTRDSQQRGIEESQAFNEALDASLGLLNTNTSPTRQGQNPSLPEGLTVESLRQFRAGEGADISDLTDEEIIEAWWDAVRQFNEEAR